MQMQMIDCLSTVRPLIDDDAVSADELQLLGQIAHYGQQMRQDRTIGVRCLCQTGNRFLGNHQNVRGRLGRNVAESQALVIFEDNVRRNLAIDNLLENGLRGNCRCRP